MRTLLATCSEYEFIIYVESNVDLDSRFDALCLDSGDCITLDGWLFTFGEV